MGEESRVRGRRGRVGRGGQGEGKEGRGLERRAYVRGRREGTG